MTTYRITFKDKDNKETTLPVISGRPHCTAHQQCFPLPNESTNYDLDEADLTTLGYTNGSHSFPSHPFASSLRGPP